jgi:hypothetical protein
MEKMLKEKNIKNLLSRIRKNVEKSANQQPEIIRNSKLLSCGPGAKAASQNQNQHRDIESPTLIAKRNSKVLINPVPVDIGRKSKMTKKDSVASPLSPERKPTSILKQSSTVLSRSISGISAIEFN